MTALIWVAGVLTCIMSLIGIFGAEFFLRLLSVPENVIGYSATYLHIIYTFVFGSVVYNGCAAILNSVGEFEDSAAGGDRFLGSGTSCLTCFSSLCVRWE